MELDHKEGDGYTTYGILSLYISKSAYSSVRQCLFHVFAKIMKCVPDDDESVFIRGNIPYFQYRARELNRKASVYANGRKVYIQYLNRSPIGTLDLAEDAGKRGPGGSIIEIFEEGVRC